METKQHNLWLLAALAAPLSHFAGCGWLTAALTAAAVLPLALGPRLWVFPKPFALAQILWLGLVAGLLLRGSAAYWPADGSWAVPMTLLTLAALTDATAAPRVGAVLAFAMGMLALPAAVSGAARMEPGWLVPVMGRWEPGLIAAFLLTCLPAAPGKGRLLPGIGLLAVVLAALVQGTLSPAGASAVSDPFYQTARALGHMEPIVAAALTLGWYAMATVLYGSAAQIAQNCGLGQRLPYVLVWGTASAAVLFGWQLSAPILNGFNAFLWVLSPFFQKMKKVKNSA